jgi:hypothetical protein
MRQPIADGKSGDAATRVSFSKPGVYVLRAYADDGVLMGYADVTVNVTAGSGGQGQR